MIVITLNYNHDDSLETSILFAVSDVNNINEIKFIQRVKEAIRPHIGNYFSLSTDEQKIESYARETLNDLKQGKNEKVLNKYTYLDFETVDIL